VVTPAVPDENKKVRAKLKKSTHINVFDRLVKSPHFAHNKFVVFCDRNDKPVSVLSGSLNWTVTGLCTQVNNSILVENPDIAADYLKRWNELKAAGDGYPKSLAKNGSKPGRNSVGGAPVTAWNVPCLKYVDLADASSYIRKAQQGVLFLMFNPGVGDGKKRAFSLLQEIDLLANSGRGIFIHGVVNQEQKAGAEATTTIVNKGKKWPPVPVGEITPKILTDAAKNWFKAAYMFNLVMIHSKVVVIDPFGPAPVVMTGSHNDGPKASMSNDDNLLIIENAPGLAAEYAVNIMSVQGHYKWLYNAYLKARARTPAGVKKAIKISPQYDGNEDDDKWQAHFRVGPNLAELDFWLGTTSPLANKPAKTTRHRK
jgi:phosphatidylserine/phosphatidylglycerophosphate/cardiolipin synthase-like enzyme